MSVLLSCGLDHLILDMYIFQVPNIPTCIMYPTVMADTDLIHRGDCKGGGRGWSCPDAVELLSQRSGII